MRIILFFDLPVLTNTEKKDYRYFVKYLNKSGFIMVQKSVYAKLTLNNSVTNSVVNGLKKNLPKKGLIQILTIKENQFNSIEY